MSYNLRSSGESVLSRFGADWMLLNARFERRRRRSVTAAAPMDWFKGFDDAHPRVFTAMVEALLSHMQLYSNELTHQKWRKYWDEVCLSPQWQQWPGVYRYAEDCYQRELDVRLCAVFDVRLRAEMELNYLMEQFGYSKEDGY